jgi:hypothetical protein
MVTRSSSIELSDKQVDSDAPLAGELERKEGNFSSSQRSDKSFGFNGDKWRKRFDAEKRQIKLSPCWQRSNQPQRRFNGTFHQQLSHKS